MMYFCIWNSLSFKFFHFYLFFVNFQCPLSSCRWVQLCKMLWTYTVQWSWYLRQKAPANPQSFLTSASALVAELPPSSIAHLPHPPHSLFPPSELFLSPSTSYISFISYSTLSSQTIPRIPLRTLAWLCHLLLSTPYITKEVPVTFHSHPNILHGDREKK